VKIGGKRLVLGALLVVALIGGGWLFFSHNGEPRYEGKSGSYWFRRYCSSQHYGTLYADGHDDAMEPLRGMGTNALPYLVSVVFNTNEDSPARTNFYNLLAKLPDSWHLPQLITREAIRNDAVQAIREIGPSARDILPLIQTELKQTNAFQHLAAIIMLGGVTNEVELVIPYLASALHDPDSEVQNMAAFELGEFGPKAGPAVPDLMAVFQNAAPGDRIRRRVALIVELIGSNAAPAVPQLKAAFDTETDWRVRAPIAACLCKIDPSQTYALDYLLGMMTNNASSREISFAASRLGEIGPSAKSAIPALLITLETNNSTHTSDDVLLALNRLGASNAQILAALKQKMALDSDDARDDAANQILDLDSTNHEAELVLIDLVKTKSEFAWKEILRLGRMGPAAQEALPVLREALDSTNVIVRVNAKFAIRAIEAKEAGK
jgi:HEAT repeat protein